MQRTAQAAALDLYDTLKARQTMGQEELHFKLEEIAPGVELAPVMAALKTMQRVTFNANNGVFSYKPELQITTAHDLLVHVRKTCALPTSSVAVKDIRESVPQGLTLAPFIEELESNGDILAVRSLGPFAQGILPKLGRKNHEGLGILDQAQGGGSRFKAMFLDQVRVDMKKKDRSLGRVEDELIWQWADVPIAETDDVVKLLAQEDLTASSQVPEEVKPVAAPAGKKKKRANRPLKITNTHMKQQGIDFSKDYVAGA